MAPKFRSSVSLYEKMKIIGGGNGRWQHIGGLVWLVGVKVGFVGDFVWWDGVVGDVEFTCAFNLEFCYVYTLGVQ